MGVKVKREQLLQVLESVSPGLAIREILEQSTCFALKDGEVITYNDEIACRADSKLPKKWLGVVPASKLLDVLRKRDEEEIEVDIVEGHFQVSDIKRRRVSAVTMEAEILMPIDKLERPEEWIPLHEEFGEAIGMAVQCYSDDESKPELTQVHIHPKWVEACDNKQAVRWRLKTQVKSSVLVRGDSLKQMCSMDMVNFSLGEAWIHFKNPNGLIFSIKRWNATYKDLTSVFDVSGGKKTSLPNGLIEEVDLANIFSSDNPDSNKVLIELRDGRMILKGQGVTGWHRAIKKVKWDGDPLGFLIAPALLSDLAKRHSECEITETRLKVDGGKFIYIASLNKPNDTKPLKSVEENGEAEEANKPAKVKAGKRKKHKEEEE